MKQTLIITFLSSLIFLNATVINVPSDQPTLQAGINATVNGDTVLVQPGTYEENINYNGKLITLASLFLTTLDTNYISSTIIDGNSSGSVVTFNFYEDSMAILNGFTITNGFSEEEGGGIYCVSASPSLQNLSISGNLAYDYGGGIHCVANSNPYLSNVAITNNTAFYGGGIYCEHSNPSLKNVAITNNSAQYGGGLACFDNANPSLEKVTISDNSAHFLGGAIFCASSNPTLINSILWNDDSSEIHIDANSSLTATYSDIDGGWGGLGNIDSYPRFVDHGSGDYHLSWTNFPIQDATMSPCIDTGDPASPLDPDGTIADMGAYYFDQITSLDPPQNVIVEIISTSVYLNWDAVIYATSYKIYSSDDPFSGFVEDTSGSFAGESWSTSILNEKKFYYVKAVR